MDAASTKEERTCGIHIKWEQVFDPGTMKIDGKFANVWLEGLPNLFAECSRIEVSELLGERVKVGNEEFFTWAESLRAASSILYPKNFAEDFPLKRSGNEISRVFLRRDLIELWNGLVDSQNTRKLNVLSAPSGLGKSIYLYLIAVFARHFGIPVQYIGNAGDLPGPFFNGKFTAESIAAMLLFMNLMILDELGTFYPGGSDYEHLRGLPMKLVIFYAQQKGDLVLCSELRRKFLTMKPRNFLIVDENDALWEKLGNDPNTWSPFFEFYARPVWTSTRYCKFVIAGSQHHEFESKLPSGYEFSIQYVEPLSLEEFAIWENLRDYPNLKEKRNEVIDLTGLVPRMIGLLVKEANSSDEDFEELARNFKVVRRQILLKCSINCFLAVRPRESQFDRSLQFYNRVARDILCDTLSELYFTSNRLTELSHKLKKAIRKGAGGDEYFEELFLGLCFNSRPDIQTYSRVSSRTIYFQSNVLYRFDGKCFDRRLSSIKMSCWIKFIRNYLGFDYAYVDMTDGRWMLCLMQVSVSSFPVHNTGSARLELLFEKSGETVPLASLLKSFFDEAFEVSPVVDTEGNTINFTVTDSRGISCRERICVLYVTPLTRSEAQVDSAPEFVEFLTLDNFPDGLKYFTARRRRSVKRKESEET
ncbi:hypothetical protein GAYE_SCF64G6687 [Galdieria yellowstonensis]|uniref:AAA+ ATPase domain-containing protein n=2 Tax=cellular organisms TaxID=131567 RepID=A0AAV9INP6_9RHOD|nr:hypothetical protein GAYE_SCF64G6687 [Galdieria yellowstonensis]